MQASGKLDLKDPYYRQLNPAAWWQHTQVPAQQDVQHASQHMQQPLQQVHPLLASTVADISVPLVPVVHPQQAALDAVYGPLVMQQAPQQVQLLQSRSPNDARTLQRQPQHQQAQLDYSNRGHVMHASPGGSTMANGLGQGLPVLQMHNAQPPQVQEDPRIVQRRAQQQRVFQDSQASSQAPHAAPIGGAMNGLGQSSPLLSAPAWD